jgi:hypothetical protein
MLNSINLTNHTAEKTCSNFNSYLEPKNKNEHNDKTGLSIWSRSLFLSVARIVSTHCKMDKSVSQLSNYQDYIQNLYK